MTDLLVERRSESPPAEVRYGDFSLKWTGSNDSSKTLLRHNGNSRAEARYLIVAGAVALLISWRAFHDPSASLRKIVTNRPFSVATFLLAGSVAVST